MTEAEIRAAMTALQQQASGQTPSGAGSTPPGVPPPPPQPRDEYQTVGYTAIYYPGATTPASAASVTLGPGEERTGVDFTVQLVRTARIEGSVVVPPGVSPQSVQLTITPAAPAVCLPSAWAASASSIAPRPVLTASSPTTACRPDGPR